MVKYIRNYFKMKAQEIQLKLTIYSCFNALIASQNDILLLIVRLYNNLKNLPIEELEPDVLKKEIIEKMVENIHQYNENKKDSKSVNDNGDKNI